MNTNLLVYYTLFKNHWPETELHMTQQQSRKCFNILQWGSGSQPVCHQFFFPLTFPYFSGQNW